MFWKWITVFVLLAVQSLRIFAVGRSAPLGEIPINIYVNDKEIYTDVDAFLEDGTTYVPIRAVSEALCVQSVTWDDAAKTAVVQGDARGAFDSGQQHWLCGRACARAERDGKTLAGPVVYSAAVCGGSAGR